MEQHNRIEAAISVWNDREKRLEKLTGGNRNNIPFLKEKLTALENLRVRYAGSMSLDERLTVQTEISGLRNVVYPNRAVRFLRSIFKPIMRQVNTWQNQKASAINTDKLSAEMIKSGFGEAVAKMTKQIQQGLEFFSIPLSYYPGEKERVDFSLNFKRDEQGQYQFTDYNTVLKDEGKVVRSHTFTPEQNLGLNQHEVANFLAGRSVLKQEPEVPWNNERWIQLDLTDKDAAGNHRVRVITADESYKLTDVLKKAGISATHLGNDLDKTTQLLKQGNQVKLSVSNGGEKKTYLIEANPVQHSVTVYDDQKRKVSLDQVLRPKATEAKVVALVPKKAQEKRVRKSKGISH